MQFLYEKVDYKNGIWSATMIFIEFMLSLWLFGRIVNGFTGVLTSPYLSFLLWIRWICVEMSYFPWDDFKSIQFLDIKSM